MQLDILSQNWLISLDHKLLPQAGTLVLDRNKSQSKCKKRICRCSCTVGCKEAAAIFASEDRANSKFGLTRRALN